MSWVRQKIFFKIYLQNGKHVIEPILKLALAKRSNAQASLFEEYNLTHKLKMFVLVFTPRCPENVQVRKQHVYTRA